jgi:hypothetical protein
VFGFDWSSEIPFFSQRRALVVPFWIEKQLTLTQASKMVDSLPVGAVVYCPDGLLRIPSALPEFPDFRPVEIAGCTVFSR